MSEIHDMLGTIANNLALRADFHRNNQTDPHGIGVASMSILGEVSDAITETLKGISEDVVDAFLWEWLEENAYGQHFKAHRYPENAPDKRWRVDTVDDQGKDVWNYGATFREAVEAAATS